MKTENELRELLAHCIGSTVWYEHGLNRRCIYTEGVDILARHLGGGAHWLLDIAATELCGLARRHGFVHLTLGVADDLSGHLVADDGNGRVLWRRNLDYVDAPPASTWSVYLEPSDSDRVCVLLPTEH
jgi:hypothetical protein